MENGYIDQENQQIAEELSPFTHENKENEFAAKQENNQEEQREGGYQTAAGEPGTSYQRSRNTSRDTEGDRHKRMETEKGANGPWRQEQDRRKIDNNGRTNNTYQNFGIRGRYDRYSPGHDEETNYWNRQNSRGRGKFNERTNYSDNYRRRRSKSTGTPGNNRQERTRQKNTKGNRKEEHIIATATSKAISALIEGREKCNENGNQAGRQSFLNRIIGELLQEQDYVLRGIF